MQPGRARAAGMRSRGGAGLGCRLRVMVRKGVRTPRGRSLFSRGKVRFGEVQTPGRRIVVDCPFLNCCGCLGRSAGQAVVRRAGPVGLCLCRCGLCHEFEWPQTAAVLDDRVRLGAGEVNRFGNMLTEFLCGVGEGGWLCVLLWATGWGCASGLTFVGNRDAGLCILGGGAGCECSRAGAGVTRETAVRAVHSSPDQAVIFVVTSDPHPDIIISIFDGERPVRKPCTHRPELADFLK